MDDIGFHTHPDTFDFRDRMYQPSLVEVPSEIPLESYQRWEVPILNQHQSWACTGFALATVVHYLLRRRTVHSDPTRVSPNMLFEMARRYDDYPGERYQGSSARGAMKGWHQHGVCAESLWRFHRTKRDARLTSARGEDAAQRPLGAYLRVNHRDLVAMHCALAEVGVLYAVTNVHKGWLRVPTRGAHAGRIDCGPRDQTLGSHAIVIVAYDEDGFWFQNSVSEAWGLHGFGFIDYDDWLRNGLDVWVGRLGVPTQLEHESAAIVASSGGAISRHETVRQLGPHIVRIHDAGYLQSNDTYGTTADDLDVLFTEALPRITRGWKRKRILLIADSGLSTSAAAVQRLADYRTSMLAAKVYPLAFIWRTDFWSAITATLRETLEHRKGEDLKAGATDFMLDRLDAALEPLAAECGGRMHWEEVKRTALAATTLKEGGVRTTLRQLAKLAHGDSKVEIHLVGHGAGALLLAPAVQLLTTAAGTRVSSGPMRGRGGLGLRVESCTLWAPACTVDHFHATFYWALRQRLIRRLLLMTLTDKAERDDHVADIYGKSLLYLISHALGDVMRVPGITDGEPLMGLERDVQTYPEFIALTRRKSVEWLHCPTTHATAGEMASTARRHGDFDDDVPTLLTTLGWILGERARVDGLTVHRSHTTARTWRRTL